MIKLSDYLNYLNSEVIQARKKADEEAILIAKEYAEHEYLKYFRVPRFSMPSVKLSIPIKIAELSSETKYNFKMNEDLFLNEVNSKIIQVNEEKNLDINLLSRDTLTKPNFVNAINKLEKNNDKFVNNIEDSLSEVNFTELVSLVQKEREVELSPIGRSATNVQNENLEINKILKDAFRKRYTIVSANLKDVFIDPDTSKETDKGKILLTLDVEMVEEGIRIHKGNDKDGNPIEEIIFE